MPREITREEAVDRLLHHLRGHVMQAIIKEYREPFQLSLYLKGLSSSLHRQIGEVLDAYKHPPEAPPTTKK